MDIKTASNVLRQLQATPSTPEIRVASRWIKASMDIEYDIMLRLQVLEGAAGFPEYSDRWWKGGRANLAKAQAHFEGEPIKEAWFSTGNTGMITTLRASAQKAIHQYRITTDPDEFINAALMGISSKSQEDKRTQQIPHTVGVKLSRNIRKGKESPIDVAKGMLAKFLWNKINTEAKGQHTNQFMVTEEGEEIIPNPVVFAKPSLSAERVLKEIIFDDPDDPLGEKIRQFMRDVWDSKGRVYAPVMNKWLDEVEAGEIPWKKDLADEFDISFGSFAKDYWNPAWQDFGNALWRNEHLLEEVQERYNQEGAVWFQKKPDIYELLPKRIRASDLAERWLQRQQDVNQT